MKLPLHLPLLLALACPFAFAQGQSLQANEPAWIVRTPQPNNPLKQAALPGKVRVGEQDAKAELQIDCRPDAGGARLNLQIHTAQLPFDFVPFEGPGGLGEKRKLVRLMIGSQPAQAHHASGYHVEKDEFVFSFALSSQEAKRLISGSAARQAASITVQPPKRGNSLSGLFRLPVANEQANSAIAPCIGNSR